MRAPSAAPSPLWSGVWLPLLLGACYLATRLLNLGLLPMVSDEGTYITWGVRALHGRGLEDWLASLEDGKQPLLAWLMPPFLTLVPDRLVAGRLVSVLCGLANLALLVALGRRLVSPAVGWIAAGLYVVAPIALLHDRMALYDSLVTTGALVVLLATVAWADDPSWRRTLWLGAAMGGALLTKLSALFFLALVPLAVALWRPAVQGHCVVVLVAPGAGLLPGGRGLLGALRQSHRGQHPGRQLPALLPHRGRGAGPSPGACGETTCASSPRPPAPTWAGPSPWRPWPAWRWPCARDSGGCAWPPCGRWCPCCSSCSPPS